MHNDVKTAIFTIASSDEGVIILLLVTLLHILGLLSLFEVLFRTGRCAFNKNLNDGFNCGGAIDISTPRIATIVLSQSVMNQAARL
jgi:hypothetical protein